MGHRRHIHLGGHRAPLSYHASLLLDPHRMDAYERAIRALVRPGDVVLDLGCGTGILAMLAARRGARHVHAVESMPVAHLARELVAANGLADRVTVHHADITAMEPVEPVDLVISDFLGAFLIDDLMLPAVAAAGRWLAPHGRCCPAEVRLVVAPADVAVRELDVWRAPFYGVDLAGALPRALAQCHRVDIGPAALLADGAEYVTYVPPAPLPRCDREVAFTVGRTGVLRAIVGWFEATLAPGVVLSTAPGIQTHWGQYLWPVPPVEVAAGDRLDLRLSVADTAEPSWQWGGELHRDDEVRATFAMSEDAGWLDD